VFGPVVERLALEVQGACGRGLVPAVFTQSLEGGEQLVLAPAVVVDQRRQAALDEAL